MASYIRLHTKHLRGIVETGFSNLGANDDGQHQVGLTVSFGTGPVKVYLGDTLELAQAAAEAGLARLSTRIGGGQVIIDIDEI